MIDRRTMLRRGAGAVGTATLAGTAGCLFGGSDGRDGAGSGFLAVLPDPTPAVVPSFHAAYSYDLVAMQENLDAADAVPDIAGTMVEVIDQLQGTAVDDVDRLSGQTLQQVGNSGGGLTFVPPNGTDLVAEGSIDVGGAANWLAAQSGLSDLGDDRGYRRFGGGGTAVEAFAVDDDSLAFGSRETTNQNPADVVAAAIDGLEDDAVPAEEISPELAAAVDSLPGRSLTVATAFDLVAERPATGTEVYDAVAASLLAAGIDAEVGEETTEVRRVLHYRRGRRARVEDVEAAVDTATANGHFHDGGWSVSWSDRTVRIEGSVSTATLREDPSPLRRAVPVPAYDDLTTPIDPTALGRDPPPRVGWEAALLDDGRVAITHGGGPSVEDVEVGYTVDGERTHQPWDGPVEPDDRLETAQAPDGGSFLDVVWARGTVDETILIRIQLPEE